MIRYLDTGYRLKKLPSHPGMLNWLFFPGGPGIGSAYFEKFCIDLDVTGTKYLFDFPKDGTNPEGSLDLSLWKNGFIDLCESTPNCIVVTHSFSGMFCLTIPDTEQYVKGLVLMATTPSNTFFEHIMAMKETHDLPDISSLLTTYAQDPSVNNYKKFWKTYKHYCFTQQEQEEAEKALALFAYNCDAYSFAVDHFYPHYKSCWVPSKIPTLTIAGNMDCICPPHAFVNNPDYARPNITNLLIQNAGHCPWILDMTTIQRSFRSFQKNVEP